MPVLTVQTCEQERLGKKGSDLRDGFQTAYHSFMVTMPVVELGTGGGGRWGWGRGSCVSLNCEVAVTATCLQFSG